MNVTLAELQSRYGPRWEIYEGYVYWLAVKSCQWRCPDPEHGSRHILFRSTLAELAEALAAHHGNTASSQCP